MEALGGGKCGATTIGPGWTTTATLIRNTGALRSASGGPISDILEIEKTLEVPKALPQKWVIPIKLDKASDDKQKEVNVAPEFFSLKAPP
jgi:hypothetical protein